MLQVLPIRVEKHLKVRNSACMIKVNVHEAKSRLSELLRAVTDEGALVRICRNGIPVAELYPVKASKEPLLQDPQLASVIFTRQLP